MAQILYHNFCARIPKAIVIAIKFAKKKKKKEEEEGEKKTLNWDTLGVCILFHLNSCLGQKEQFTVLNKNGFLNIPINRKSL